MAVVSGNAADLEATGAALIDSWTATRPAAAQVTVSAARNLIEGGQSPARAAKQLTIGRATACRIAAAMRDEDRAPSAQSCERTFR